MPFVNRVLFEAAAGGTGTFTVSAAVSGFLTPAQSGAVDGGTYSYVAESLDNSEWEIGTGVYTASGTTLTRANVLLSSNANALVDFTPSPNVSLTFLAEDLDEINDTSAANAAAAAVSASDAATALANCQALYDAMVSLPVNGNIGLEVFDTDPLGVTFSAPASPSGNVARGMFLNGLFSPASDFTASNAGRTLTATAVQMEGIDRVILLYDRP